METVGSGKGPAVPFVTALSGGAAQGPHQQLGAAAASVPMSQGTAG